MVKGRGSSRSAKGGTPDNAGGVLTEMQMKVFLDRYALKGKDPQPGKQALVMEKKSPYRGQVVTVSSVENGSCQVDLASGEKASFDKGAIVELEEVQPSQMWDRVAKAIASVEETEEKRAEWTGKFRWALDGFKFVPGGRILAGAGSGKDVTYYNCYVIPSPHDSRKGIVHTLQQMIEIMARGGGVGINGSSLRPQGAYVRGVNGTSSGAVSWMEIYSDATGLIEQGGSRRGALMLMLAAWHPDIETFVTVKRDLNRFNNANLSVVIPDSFMEAVEADGEWDLIFPETDDPDYKQLWDGDIAAWKAAGKPVRVYKTIKARQLWDLICESNWLSGEPGVVFLERYNKLSNTWYFQKIISVNPCFTGSTRLSTSKGLLTFEELYKSQEKIEVITDLRAADEAKQVVGGARHARHGVVARPALPVYKTAQNVPVFSLTTSHGYEVTATANHRFLTPRGYVELRNLLPGDTLYLQAAEGGWGADKSLPMVDWSSAVQAKLRARSLKGEVSPPKKWSLEVGRFLGWALASGHMSDRGSSPRLSLGFGSQEKGLIPYFRNLTQTWFGVMGGAQIRNRKTVLNFDATVARFAQSLGLKAAKAEERRIPDALWRAPREAVVGFLQGLFTARGTVCEIKDSCTVCLEIKSKDLIQEVQLLLLNMGIVSRLDQDELVIDRDNLNRFAIEVGFFTPAKQVRLLSFVLGNKRRVNREFFSTRVVDVAYAGLADVYDTTEPVTHSLVANGIVAHNCGEQGLPGWGVCNLGSIGLSAFVKDGRVDWEGLGETVRVAVRFLDNVIDETKYVFEENRQSQLQARRIGLGTQGLAHMLIKLGLRYGSPEGNAFIERLYRFIMEEAYRASVELAREKGPFGSFDPEKYLQGQFIKQLPEDLRQAVAQYGIRNATLLTQAPTGTTSLLAGMSSGIEPVFRFKMKRVDRIGEHYIYDPLYKEWEDANPGASRPDYYVEAGELTPEEHVTVQAIIQRYVDSSISKTVNAPANHTIEDTKRVYELAYKLGCKGITYFREGSRTGVLSEVKEGEGKGKEAVQDAEGAGKREENQQAGAGAVRQLAILPQVGGPRDLAERAGINGTWGDIRPIDRPLRLQGFTDVKETPLGKLFLTLNVLDGHPIELFAQIGKAGSDVSGFTEAVARLVSLLLRSGVAPDEVAAQLTGIGGSRSVGFGPNRVRSVPDAIGQFLGEYLNRWHDSEAHKSAGGSGASNQLGNRGYDESQPPLAATQAQTGGAAAEVAASSTASTATATMEQAATAGFVGKVALNGNGNGDGHGGFNGEKTAKLEALLSGQQRPGSLSLCPSCGDHSLAPVEGCSTCLACGYSEC